MNYSRNATRRSPSKALTRLLGATLVVAVPFFLSGCFRLDSFMNSPLSLTSYSLENATYAELPDINTIIPDSAVHSTLVHFQSGSDTLYGYLLQHATQPATTVLYFHGNYHDLDVYWPRAKLLYYMGYDVFIFDYQGYGMSTGTPTEQGLYDDATAAMDFLLSQTGISPSNVLIYGYSLGTVPATYLASSYPGISAAKGLVLEGPVGAAVLYVQDATDLPLPAGTLVNLKIDDAEMIKNVTIPLLIIQGNADGTNRYDTHGTAVYDNYGGTTKYRLIVPGADHTDVPKMMGGTNYSVYRNVITDFVNGSAPHL